MCVNWITFMVVKQDGEFCVAVVVTVTNKILSKILSLVLKKFAETGA